MNSLLKKCNKLGLKMTEQRKIIVKVLSESKDHPDVELVYKRASEVDKNIGIATVYRTIRLFEENNIIEKHEFKDGRFRYEEVPDEHHDHLIDVRNGRVIEFQNDEIENLQKKVAKELGYELVDHRLELYGVPIKKKIEYNLSKDRFSKLRIVLSKAKYVAKNVVYIKNWSKNIPLNSSVKKNTIDKDESKLNFSFKNYVVKIIRDPDPLLIKAKELRQKIFFNDTGVHSLDSDEFDRICDHLIVIDKSISSDHVVGTYRLLLKQNENKKFKFYSESEFNISNLKKKKKT